MNTLKPQIKLLLSLLCFLLVGVVQPVQSRQYYQEKEQQYIGYDKFIINAEGQIKFQEKVEELTDVPPTSPRLQKGIIWRKRSLVPRSKQRPLPIITI